MKKRILSALLCAILAVTSMVSANAAEVKEHKGFKDLGEEIYLENNTVTGFVYNVEEDYSVYVKYTGEEKEYNLYFKDCISAPVSIRIPDTEKYMMYVYGPAGGVCDEYYKSNFATKGGRYKKVKIKLSEFSSYFNEDGTHTIKKTSEGSHDFNFTDEGNGFKSQLVLFSGGAANGVVPDENGEVEIFVSTKIGRGAFFYTNFAWKYGGGGGVTGSYGMDKLEFGNVDGSSWVDVNDITTLQLYLAGLEELDTLGLFHADVNCDDVYDVNDVTALQFGIAGL